MKRVFLLIGVSVLLAIPAAFAKPADDQFVVVIDAGHGGHDAGATGRRGREKDINLAVALYTGKYIKEHHPDVKLIYTRTTDVFIELNERANIANRNKADLFISVHTNSATGASARGPEVYSFGVSRTAENLAVAKRENSVIQLEDNYQEKYEGFDPNSAESYIIFEFMQNKFVEQSIQFATQVENRLKKCVPWNDRGVKQAQFLVLRKSSMPRVLVELGFISNPQEEEILLSDHGRHEYAKAIGEAFTQYKAEYDRKNGKKPRIVKSLPAEQKDEMNATESAPVGAGSARPGETSVEQRPAPTRSRVYKVQILSSPKKLSPKSPQLKGYKADFYVDKGTYKYTVGESESMDEISEIHKAARKDFKDAFIVPFEEGKRVK